MDGGDPAGGSRVLAQLIDRYGEELTYDLRRYLQLDLRDIFRPDSGLSPRLVLSYIKHLPSDSAFGAARQGGPQFRGWGPNEYLLAAVFDAIRANTYALVSAHSERRPKAPTPLPRPKKKRDESKPNLFTVMAAHHMTAAKKAKETKDAGTGR